MKNKISTFILLSILIILSVFAICLEIISQPKEKTIKYEELDSDIINQIPENYTYDSSNDEDYNHLMSVQQLQILVSEFVKSKQFQKSNTEQRLKLAEDFMKILVERKMIKDYEIDLSGGASEPNMLYFLNDDVFETLMHYEERSHLMYEYNDEGYEDIFGILKITDFAKDQN